MSVKRMDNVGTVVEDLDASIEFFIELGLALEGRMRVDGEWAGRVTGVRDQRVEIAMMQTPDSHSRLELSRFDAPAIASDHHTAPVNSLVYLRVMFAVDDINDTLPLRSSTKWLCVAISPYAMLRFDANFSAEMCPKPNHASPRSTWLFLNH